MNTVDIGEYPGTLEDVLARHEWESSYIPASYPDFSDKQWYYLWKSYKRYLRYKKSNEEKIRSEQIAQSRIIREVIIRIQTLIQKIIDLKKQQISENRQGELDRMQSLAAIKSGDPHKAQSTFFQYSDYLEKESTEYIITLLFTLLTMQKSKGKRSQKISNPIIEHIVWVLQSRGIEDCSLKSIASLYGKISQDLRAEFARKLQKSNRI